MKTVPFAAVDARYGYDLSNNNHRVAFEQIPRQDFWYHKASEGTGFTDPYLKGPAENREMVFDSRHEPYGTYHFIHCGWGSVADEVKRFIDSGGGDGLLRPVCDLEATIIGPQETASFAAGFCDGVAHELAVAPLIYTGAWFMQPRNGGWCAPDPTLARFDLWLSEYPLGYAPVGDIGKLRLPAVPAPWSSWLMWQFTSSAPLPGYAGGTDRSVIDAANFARLLKHPTPTPPTPPHHGGDGDLRMFVNLKGSPGQYLWDGLDKAVDPGAIEVANRVLSAQDKMAGGEGALRWVCYDSSPSQNGTADYHPIVIDPNSPDEKTRGWAEYLKRIGVK